MADVIIFGGTTEGRLLAESCADLGIQAVVCVVSEYGNQVLRKSPYLSVKTKAMDEEMMVELIEKEKPLMVLDATHPYASVVTGNILQACEKTGAVYQRVSRKEAKDKLQGTLEQVVWVEDAQEAAAFLSERSGKVFLTTGSKELQAYTKIPGYEERIYARVLPGEKIIAQCREYGITGSHLIGMQGPFSREMNIAMLNHTGAKYLVTKEAGTAGGFMEKIEAALACGVTVVVIGRPQKPEGVSIEKAVTKLKEVCKKIQEPEREKKYLTLIGIGMGGKGQLTLEAVERLKNSDVVLGAYRMLESIESLVPGVRKEACYLSKDVITWLQHHGEYENVCIVYSGDTGFYSGASGLLEEIGQAGHELSYETEVVPGISTVSYLCAKLKTSWEDAFLTSIHGREADICSLMKQYKKIFLLLGGEDSVKKLCRTLIAGGYEDAMVSVGQRLSYENEQVVTKTAKELEESSFDSLTAVLIRQLSCK